MRRLVLALLTIALLAVSGPVLLAGQAGADTMEELGPVLPEARDGAAAVWTGEHAYLFGGESEWVWQDDVLRFSPDTEQVVETQAQLPWATDDPSAVWDGRSLPGVGCPEGCAYVFHDRSVARYQPHLDRVQELDLELPEPVIRASVVWTGDAAYVLGGDECDGHLCDGITRVDPVEETTTMLDERLPYGVLGAGAVWTGEEAYLLAGYANQDPDDEDITDRIIRFDPATGRAETIETRLPEAVLDAPAVWDGHAAVLYGGWDDQGLRDGWQIFNPANETAVHSGFQFTARAGLAAVWAGDRAFLFGGTTSDDWEQDVFEHTLEPDAPELAWVDRDLEATTEGHPDRINVTWAPPHRGSYTHLYNYTVYRQPTIRPGGWEPIATVSPDKTVTVDAHQESWYVDDVDVPGRYQYAVSASNAWGESPWATTEPILVAGDGGVLDTAVPLVPSPLPEVELGSISAVQAVAETSVDAHAEVEASDPAVLPTRGSILIDREVGPTGFILGHDPMTGEPIHNTAMGVRDGSGTVEDPYVISNWTLVHTAPFALRLENTAAHVVIQNLSILGEGVETPTTLTPQPPETITKGIELQSAENVTIRDVWIRESGAPGSFGFAGVPGEGITMVNAENVSVESVRLGPIDDARRTNSFFLGIYASQSENLQFQNVSISHAIAHGLFVDSSSITLSRVNLEDTPQGASFETQFQNVEDVTLEDSLIQGSTMIFLEGFRNISARGNMFNATAVHGLSSIGDGEVLEPEVADNGLRMDRGEGTSVDVCGNVFHRHAVLPLAISADQQTVRGNTFTELAGSVPLEGHDVVVEQNGFDQLGRVRLETPGAEVHQNSITNTFDFIPNQIVLQMNVSSNWWGDAAGPDLVEDEDFSEDGVGLKLKTERDNVTFKPFLDAPPATGPSTVDCGDPFDAGVKQGPPARVFGAVEAKARVGVDGVMDRLGGAS